MNLDFKLGKTQICLLKCVYYNAYIFLTVFNSILYDLYTFCYCGILLQNENK